MDNIVIFVPINKHNPIATINIDEKLNQKFHKYPFLYLPNEKNIVDSFIKAVCEDLNDEINRYISKYFIDKFDFDILKEMIHSSYSYKTIEKINYNKYSRDCRINSMLIVDNENNKKEIMNLYLIYEPDNFSAWKIYAIDREKI